MSKMQFHSNDANGHFIFRFPSVRHKHTRKMEGGLQLCSGENRPQKGRKWRDPVKRRRKYLKHLPTLDQHPIDVGETRRPHPSDEQLAISYPPTRSHSPTSNARSTPGGKNEDPPIRPQIAGERAEKERNQKNRRRKRMGTGWVATNPSPCTIRLHVAVWKASTVTHHAYSRVLTPRAHEPPRLPSSAPVWRSIRQRQAPAANQPFEERQQAPNRRNTKPLPTKD
ncbi:hypothetical protein B0H16DRAFT_1460218 [Mycena metata]|uniref:Uncharacterized protein n=1 Tax=Mycena metata TaxID=1033252 RepID=A0AAD7NAL3_9AGAR|nr:hypothetical protein B0H16DRAFT_1460218 [Mycena metata]